VSSTDTPVNFSREDSRFGNSRDRASLIAATSALVRMFHVVFDRRATAEVFARFGENPVGPITPTRSWSRAKATTRRPPSSLARCRPCVRTCTGRRSSCAALSMTSAAPPSSRRRSPCRCSPSSVRAVSADASQEPVVVIARSLEQARALRVAALAEAERLQKEINRLEDEAWFEAVLKFRGMKGRRFDEMQAQALLKTAIAQLFSDAVE
jgi:hypothetical protein